jgi:hypothetical protein
MPMVTSETVKQVLMDIYDYKVSDDDARSIAHSAGSMLTLATHLDSLGLTEIAPPFGYPVLTSEATRVANRKP